MKTNSKKLCSLLLATTLVASVLLPASAAEEDISPTASYNYNIVRDSVKNTGVSAGQYTYTCYSTLYYDTSSHHAKASVWAVENNRQDGAGTVRAYLYKDNAVRADSKDRTSSSYIQFAETGSMLLDGGTIKADGEYKLYHRGSSGTYTGGRFNPVTYYAAARSAVQDEPIVTSYPVTQNGETYGSYLDRHTVGYAPELISAVGVDETLGYVRLEDFAPEFDTLEEEEQWQDEVDKDNLIPLYDLEGNVIGQYALGTRQEAESIAPQSIARIASLGEDVAAIFEK